MFTVSFAAEGEDPTTEPQPQTLKQEQPAAPKEIKTTEIKTEIVLLKLLIQITSLTILV